MKALQPFVRKNYYWRIINKHQILGMTVLLLVSTLGIIFTALRNPVYEAQAKLRFKASSLNNYSVNDQENNQFIGNLGQIIAQDNFINTEIEIIKSYPLIKKTINFLNQENPTNNSIDIKTFSNNLKLKKLGKTDILLLKYQDTDPVRATESVNQLIINYLDDYIGGRKKEFSNKKQLIQQELSKFQQKLQQTETEIRKLQEETNLFMPQEEAIILATNLGLVEQKIAELQGQIANVNAKSAYIRSKLGMDSDRAIASTRVGQSLDIQEAVRQLQQLESQLAQEQTRFPDANPIITDLEAKIRQQKRLIQQKIPNFAGSQDINFSQAREFSKIQQNLTEELVKLEASNLGLQQQIKYLLELEKAQQEKANLFPQVLLKLQQLKRQLAVFQTDYESLLQQIRNIEARNNLTLSNIRVISYAVVPTKPIRANYINYLASVGLGIFTATLAIILAEIIYTSYTTIEELKKLFGYTWLGIIPDLDYTPSTSTRPKHRFYHLYLSLINPEKFKTTPSLPRVIVRDKPRSSASESYRILQSNIKFLSTYKEVKIIVVTSSVSQEGKSTVAANLACAMAQAKHKVLLIDGNLHYPIQHQIWEQNLALVPTEAVNDLKTAKTLGDIPMAEKVRDFSTTEAFGKQGLSNVIIGQADTSQVIQQVFPGLNLISSGTIPTAPASLLDCYRMKSLIDDWRKSYDFIIIDTPPLDLAADAPILGRIADGVLLVVNPDKINHSKANFAKEILLRSGQNVLGIVFNKINPEVEPKNYFYNALEERGENLSQPQKIEQSKEELWLTISRMYQESKKPKFDLTPEEIISIPTEQLQEIVNCLQQDLEDLTQLVKEQEEELFMQNQMVKKLQKRVNLSRDIDRSFLAQYLSQEQERRNMLNATLVGQRRNLQRKQRILEQYCQALMIKQAE